MDLAFENFKGAVTQDEFAAILTIARDEYDSLLKVSKAREEFRAKTYEGIRQVKEQSIGMPPKLAEKLIEGLKRRAEQDVEKHYAEKIKRHRSVTDFLNRFQMSDELLPYLDFKIKNQDD